MNTVTDKAAARPLSSVFNELLVSAEANNGQGNKFSTAAQRREWLSQSAKIARENAKLIRGQLDEHAALVAVAESLPALMTALANQIRVTHPKITDDQIQTSAMVNAREALAKLAAIREGKAVV